MTPNFFVVCGAVPIHYGLHCTHTIGVKSIVPQRNLRMRSP